MANLLNVLPQASSNVTSPLDLKADGKIPKLESKELKELFQKNLSDKLSKEKEVDAENIVADETADLAEVALAAGAIAAPKTELKAEIKTDPKVTAELSKQAGVAGHSAGKSAVKPATQQMTSVNGLPITDLKAADSKNAVVKTTVAGKAIQIPNQLSMEHAEAVKAVGLEVASNPTAAAEVTSAMAAQLEIPSEHEFDVDSLEVKQALPKEASSKLSTNDFLNLREISQKPNLVTVRAPLNTATDTASLLPLQTTGAVVGMRAAQKKGDQKEKLPDAMIGLAPAHGEKNSFVKTMDATVTQTGMQKPVLSQESVTQMGSQINLLGQARQDGEIKIRLRPDHLGELQMSVKTQGQNVSVQIKAESNEAKKIIEDSLGALREHLSLQNLSLARIDVVTQPTASSNLEQTQMHFDTNQGGKQNSQQEGFQQQSSGREFYREKPAYVPAQASIPIRPRTTEASRLDLIA